MDNQKNTLTIPTAIVVAAIIIGGAIFVTRDAPRKEIFNQPEQAPKAITGSISYRPLSPDEHLVGNPEAPIVMLEYSDLECPFCKSFHKTMKSLLDQYGKSGDVAWAYRHFPLEIHPRASKEAEATECASELGGNEAFWAYANNLFDITPANNGLDPAQLPQIAVQTGLDLSAFENCLDSGRYAQKVKDDYQDGLNAGVNGTPHTILILKTPLTESAQTRLAEINQQILLQLPPGSRNVITVNESRTAVGVSGAFQYVTLKEILDLILSGK
ncbi:MAG: DsbA family protein [Candidatus Taylorbacteria bacterium]|nr:DsbA family protein [Candidatus Taylorbacteria bacterium]